MLWSISSYQHRNLRLCALRLHTCQPIIHDPVSCRPPPLHGIHRNSGGRKEGQLTSSLFSTHNGRSILLSLSKFGAGQLRCVSKPGRLLVRATKHPSLGKAGVLCCRISITFSLALDSTRSHKGLPHGVKMCVAVCTPCTQTYQLRGLLEVLLTSFIALVATSHLPRISCSGTGLSIPAVLRKSAVSGCLKIVCVGN